MNLTYGSWLKDAHTRGKVEKIWTTYETDHRIIYQFDDKTEFRNNKAKELHLKMPGFQVHARFRERKKTHILYTILNIVRHCSTNVIRFNEL